MKLAVTATLLSSLVCLAQSPPPAVDVTGADIQAFLKSLPKDAVSDKPIRVMDAGGYKVGVYGVLRPKATTQEAILHETTITEIYYMLSGAGTLVTGGSIVSPKNRPGLANTSVVGPRIEGGVSRKVTPGDVIIIPGRTPHWWSNLENDITYLIYRPDPEGKQKLK